MFDYAYNNNYTIDEEKKQDTNDNLSFRSSVHKTVDWLCGLYITFKKRPKYKESYSFLM